MNDTPYKLSFDGCGLNDANDKYKKRLFTLRSEDRDSLQDFGKYVERAVNNHDELLGALRYLVSADHDIHANKGLKSDQAMTRIAALDMAERAIAKAEGKG